MIKLRYILITCCLFTMQRVFSQELNFTQYYNAPLLVNPANTGFNPDYDFRVGGNYRNQWANVMANPFATMSVWADAQLFTNKFDNGWVGVGGAIYSDKAGSGNLVTNKGYASVAYHQMIGYGSLLSFGVSAGVANKRIDVTKLTFDNQWSGKFFDFSIPSNEPFVYSSNTYIDLQVGLNYAWFVSEKAYVNVGFSMLHVNRPQQSFFAANSSADQRIAPRYTAFVNGNFKIGDSWIVNPNMYISKMATATETVVGINANRSLSDEGRQQLILGAYYRVGDAIAPIIGFQTNDLKITFNYDVTTSSLSSFNGKQGAYEVSIIKSGLYGNGGKAIKCPTVKF